MPGVFDETNQESGRIYTGTPDGYEPWVDAPFFESMADIQPVREAYKNVLSDVGCTQPVFDDHDQRIVRETLGGTYTYSGSYTNLPGIPDAHTDVGGWEDYPSRVRTANWDSDHDGLPDWWETHYGLNTGSPPGDFTDANSDPDGDGYTYLDDYLNWMALPHYFISEDSILEITIPDLFRGYENSPVYSFYDVNAGDAVLLDDTVVQFTPESVGMGSLTLKVEDAAGDTMVRPIGIFTGGPAVTDKTTGYHPVERPSIHAYCYPNPATEKVFIAIETELPAKARIIITNILGNRIMEKTEYLKASTNIIQIDTRSFVSGIYNIHIRTGTNQKSVLFIRN